jgi:N6-L-threonylcarbamoyladenine synthase
LRTVLTKTGADMGFRVVFPHLQHCSDNAAMIAAAGYYSLKRGLHHDLSLNAHAVLSLATWQTGPLAADI